LTAPAAQPTARPGADADPPGHPGLEQAGGRDADERHHRADRKVDPAGQDHGDHPHRHDPDRREVAGDVEEIVARGEGFGLLPGRSGADQRHREGDPERLVGDDALEEGAFLEAGHLLDGDAGLDRSGGLHRGSGVLRRSRSHR
jgi:hypothetical protein